MLTGCPWLANSVDQTSVTSLFFIMSTESYDHASKLETNDVSNQLERLRTAGGHIDDRGQPSLPVVHRNFANPSPLGLLSFATGINI
jgi:hypothetical protein